jgi:hypothetical protein
VGNLPAGLHSVVATDVTMLLPPLVTHSIKAVLLTLSYVCSQFVLLLLLQDVQRADAVVYGMGSLYTSICPTLILDGVGEAIAARSDIPKVRAYNNCCCSYGLNGSDCICCMT